MDNLRNLRGVAEFFSSFNSDEFISRLARMFVMQEPHCVIVRGLPVTGDKRPDNLHISIEHTEQSGEKYSKEILRLLNEKIGGNRVVSEMGNVIRVVDPTNPKYIKREPTHTHPEVRINNMFCNVSDGIISKVTFLDDVWNISSKEQRLLFQKYKFVNVENNNVLWNEDFVLCDDIFEHLHLIAGLLNEDLTTTAGVLSSLIQKHSREYYLAEGDMIFFAQLKTLRGADAYSVPNSGIEKRWYQSMTFAWKN